jgi:hypothetical protein
MMTTHLFQSTLLLLLSRILVVQGEGEAADALETWQECEVFLAPTTMGWGVYAARDFEEGDVVQITPLFVLLEKLDEHSPVQASALVDYVYGHQHEDVIYDNVLFGMGMFYNHHPEPNVVNTFVAKPYTGWTALKRIEAGEQLFSNYDPSDGGEEWFRFRGIEMQAPPESRIAAEDLPLYLANCCSKIYAGVGMPKWTLSDGEMYNMESRLAPFDAGLGDAKAKVDIAEGESIETGFGLAVSRELMRGTLIAPLLMTWDNFDENQKQALRILQQSGRLVVKGSYNDQPDSFKSFEDLAILPVAGNIGLVRRGDFPSNCRLVVDWRAGQSNSYGVTFQLVATQNIKAGDVLMMEMSRSGEDDERRLLEEQMNATGNLYYDGFLEDTTCAAA